MNEILGKIIDLMRAEGLDIDSPYDVENFFEDHGSHSDMFETGRFGFHCEQCGNLFTGKVRTTENSSDAVFCSDECITSYLKDIEGWNEPVRKDKIVHNLLCSCGENDCEPGFLLCQKCIESE
jgi:hypothetical protein